LEGRRQIPWQEFLDVANRMIGDSGQHSSKVELRIEPIELRRTYEAVHGCGTFSAAVGSHEQEDDMTASGDSDCIG
jgi:hypothetical protein